MNESMCNVTGKCKSCGSSEVTVIYGPAHDYGAEYFNLSGAFENEIDEKTKKLIIKDIIDNADVSVDFSCEGCEDYCSADVTINGKTTDDPEEVFEFLIPEILKRYAPEHLNSIPTKAISFKTTTPPIAVKSNSNAKDIGFYFQLVRQVSGPFYLITPKAYYDKEGALSDESGIADNVVPKGFYELTESTYEFEGSPEVGRQLLIDNGFTEIDFGFHNQVPPMEGNDDEFHEERHEYDEIETLLNESPADDFDYKNMATDKLLRHIKMMIMTESFEEAEKIKVELHSRGVTEF